MSGFDLELPPQALPTPGSSRSGPLESPEDGSFTAMPNGTEDNIFSKYANSTISTAGSSVSSNSNSNSNTTNEPRPSGKKRRRRPLNCNFCRSRKLKCDRQLPCSNCVKRKAGAQCTYVGDEGQEISGEAPIAQPKIYMGKGVRKQPPAVTIKSLFRTDQEKGAESNYHMKDRLDKMENLILSILNNGDRNGSTSTDGDDGQQHAADEVMAYDLKRDDLDHDIMRIGDSLGMMKLDRKGKSVYLGEMHWSTLMDDVNEIQDFFQRLRQQYEAQAAENATDQEEACFPNLGPEVTTSAIPFAGSGGRAGLSTAQDILSLIPERAVCDKLVSRFMGSWQPVMPVLHRPTFQAAYDRFWQDPQHTELIYLALLFAVLALGMQSYTPSELPKELKDKPQLYNQWVQAMETCSHLSRITLKPSLINIRVLLLWIFVLAGTYNAKEFMERSWVIMGTLTRTAQSMGLHRDPRWFSLSPFESHERRRLWSLVQNLDGFLSISQGLPSGLRLCETDTSEPLNINDEDISPSSVNVPSKYGLAVATSQTFLICRTRLQRIIAQIVEFNLSLTRKKTYEQALKLDSQLRETYNSIPLFLRTKAHASLANEPAELVVQRFLLEMDYLKGIVSLHRPFTRSTDVSHRQSITEVYEASACILERHRWFYCSMDAMRTRNRFFAPLAVITTPQMFHAAMTIMVHLLRDYDKDPVDGDAKVELVKSSIPAFEFPNFLPSYNAWQVMMLNVIVEQLQERIVMSPEERRRLDYQIKSKNASRTLEMWASDNDPSVEHMDKSPGLYSGSDGVSPLGTSGSASSGSNGQPDKDGYVASAMLAPSSGMMFDDDLLKGVSDAVGADEWDQIMKNVEVDWLSGQTQQDFTFN
uniref:ARAD1C27280p n=1 Tax=Blastobotrys adeninivorans TaxID=409370 RepID=A0A060T7C5_BLAAD